MVSRSNFNVSQTHGILFIGKLKSILLPNDVSTKVQYVGIQYPHHSSLLKILQELINEENKKCMLEPTTFCLFPFLFKQQKNKKIVKCTIIHRAYTPRVMDPSSYDIHFLYFPFALYVKNSNIFDQVLHVLFDQISIHSYPPALS